MIHMMTITQKDAFLEAALEGDVLSEKDRESLLKFANEDERHCDAEEFVTVQSCIDKVKDKRVFVVATANNIRKLPGSLTRPGRFDHILELRSPEGQDAEDIVAFYLSKKSKSLAATK